MQPPIYEEFIDFLAREISPEAIIDFRLSSQNQARFEALVLASKSGTISRDEQHEFDQHVVLEHVIQLLKAKARFRQQTE